MKRYYRAGSLILADIICVNVSYILALLLRYDFDINTRVFQGILQTYESNLIIITLITCLMIAFFRGYRTYIRYMQLEDSLWLIIAMIISQALISLVVRARDGFIPGSVYAIAFFISVVLVTGIRIVPKNMLMLRKFSFQSDKNQRKNEEDQDQYYKNQGQNDNNQNSLKRIMVVGTNNEAAGFVIATNRNALLNKKVVAIVDDISAKKGLYICGAKVISGIDKIRQTVRKYDVEEIFIIMPDAGDDRLAMIAEECAKTKCKTVIMPRIGEIVDNKPKIKEAILDTNKLLNRPKATVDKRLQLDCIEGKIVMIIGAAGSVGEQLAKDLVKLKPRRMLLVDINKKVLENLMNSISNLDNGVEVEAIFCTVSRTEIMKDIFANYKPHLVYFTATCGEGVLVKANEKQAMLVNLKGAVNAMELSHSNGAERFILVSDIEAFGLDNMYKMTSRLAQLFAQEYSLNSDTKFIVMCVGKILDTNSGFLGRLIYQVKKGMTVDAPSGDAMAHFITVEDASNLIIEAGRLGEGGEIFCANMSSAVNLKELTENTIRMLGFIPYAELDISIGTNNYYNEHMGEKGLDAKYLTKTSNSSIYRYDFIEESEEVVRLLRSKNDERNFEVFIENLILEQNENIEKWLKKALHK